MFRRSLLFVSLCLLAVTQAPMLASAVEIDPELREQFAAKADHEKIPVLMIFDDPIQVDADLLAELASKGPNKRRKAVLAALKKKYKRNKGSVSSLLLDPRHKAGVGQIQELYLANAISFEANWNLVTELGGLPDAATLFYDKTYDLTTATQRGVNSAKAVQAAAAVDTVWSVQHINADRVWRELGYTGNGVLIAHIDSGVLLSHPDLAGRLWTNPGEIAGNGIDDDGNGFIDDVVGWDFGVGDNNPDDDSPTAGHGTHTAGSVVGDGTGGTLTGTAPGARIMALKVWQADGAGGSLGTMWAAQQYAVENGARIITMSLGISGAIPPIFLRAERYNDNNIRDAGVTFFNSAGNEHGRFIPPVELDLTARVPAPWSEFDVPRSSTGGVISVGASGYRDDSLATFSSQGPAQWDTIEPWNDWAFDPGSGLIKPDMAAPGVGVNSTVLGGGYSGDTWSGTSMACPHAAGVAALMLEKNPSLSPAGIDSLMELNAVDLGAPGKDNGFGAGRLDAFAIVNAVPGQLNPDLTWVAVLPDPAGDGVLDSGDVSELAFTLRNVSPVVAAENVTAALAVVANPWVTVNDDEGNFADLAAGGAMVNNLADGFSLNVDAAAPEGFEFTMLLTVSANTGYEQTYDVPWYVGLPDWRTHDQGGMYLTVTDQGIIGYLSQDQVQGGGMGFENGGSGLFLGSFWAGTDEDYICNRDYGGLGTENFEWVVSDVDPNGRVRDLGASESVQTYQAVFTDGGHAEPKPLQVEQTTMAFGSPENNQFVILEYRLTNLGPTDLPSLYNGVFCDFDLGDAGANLGGTDDSRNLTYLYEDGGTYMGMALLGGARTAQNLTVISNPTYVFGTSAIKDGDKMQLLRGEISVPVSDKADDWSALTSSVVSLAADGGQAVVAYAMVVGASVGEIQAAVDAANFVYGTRGPDTVDTPPKPVRLAQNTPNPFNPSTEIKFTVAQAGLVDMAVYDLSGRRIRTLVSENLPAGDRTATWDGRDDGGLVVPSGMYFYRYVSGGVTLSRKMTLVR